jgi:hypothetical protein
LHYIPNSYTVKNIQDYFLLTDSVFPAEITCGVPKCAEVIYLYIRGVRGIVYLLEFFMHGVSGTILLYRNFVGTSTRAFVVMTCTPFRGYRELEKCFCLTVSHLCVKKCAPTFELNCFSTHSALVQ